MDGLRAPHHFNLASRSRLNLVLEANLKDWAKHYARRNGTTVTRIIIDHLKYLRDREQATTASEPVDQI